MSGRIVITQAKGDLTGDGIPEVAALTGFQEEGSSAWQGIRLEIQDGASCLVTRLALQQDAGYDPRLLIGSLTGAGRQDVLVSIDSGGSGGLGYYTVYAYRDGAYRRIFDTEDYQAAYSYEIDYLDQYAVRAVSHHNGQAYLIDLSAREPAYLSEIYLPDGMLREARKGFVDPPGLLYPADINGDGVLELVVYQRISGLYHADGLGDFINMLAWDGRQFALAGQTVGVFGVEAR